MSDPIAAATVVLVRDGLAGLETLLLRRSSTGSFGGMWVFPGGRVDPGDVDPSDTAHDGGDVAEVRAARRAAVREAREEAGLDLDPEGLVVLSHWVPPAEAPRRFSTWFFLAAAPDSADVVVDGGEIHDHGWLRPADAIAQRDEGVIELAPPTWVTLWRLHGSPDAASALVDARAREPERFSTRVGRTEGALVALWHGDEGYDDGDAVRPGPRHRLSMGGDGWRYERTP